MHMHLFAHKLKKKSNIFGPLIVYIYIYILELASKLMCPRDGSGCGEFGPSSGAILGPLASHDASCVPARKPSQARLLEKAL